MKTIANITITANKLSYQLYVCNSKCYSSYTCIIIRMYNINLSVQIL